MYRIIQVPKSGPNGITYEHCTKMEDVEPYIQTYGQPVGFSQSTFIGALLELRRCNEMRPDMINVITHVGLKTEHFDNRCKRKSA